ncbi:MAG: hypothetical protein JTT12_05975 [Candidatus Brockarchaeota archaeon]|nr:hypothetical protein [Candidatus Brockarchaeota archaeon]
MSSTQLEKQSVWSKPLIEGADGLTLRVLLVGLIYDIVTMYLSLILMFKYSISWQIPLFVFFVAELILMKISRTFQFSAQEWVTFLAVSSTYPFTFVFIITPPSLAPLGWPTLVQYMPSFWRVDLNAPAGAGVLVKDAFMSGGPVAWGVWIPTIAFWSLTVLFLYLMGFFIILPMRRSWIDVERVVVPTVVPTYELIRFAKAEGRPSLWNFAETKWLWFGIIIGIVLTGSNWVSAYTGLNIYLNQVTIPVDAWLGPLLKNTPFNAGPLLVYFIPTTVLWTFAPLDILETAVLGYLVITLLIPTFLAYAGVDPIGQWTGGPGSIDAGPFGRYTGFFRYKLMFSEWYAFGGIVWGVAIWFFFREYKRYLQTIQMALKGEAEEGEPFSWRTSWIGFLIGFLGLIAMMVISGASPISGILAILFIIVFTMYSARFNAELATYLPGNFSMAGMYMNSLMSSVGLWPASTFNADKFTTLATYEILTWTGGQQNTSSGMYSIQWFKIADVTKTKTKTVAISLLIAVLVSTLMAAAFYIMAIHDPSIGGFQGASSKFWGVSYSGKGYWPFGGFPIAITNVVGTKTIEAQFNAPTFAVFGWIGAGALLTIICYYLRTVFPWFFINPIAFTIVSRSDQILPILFAFILKWAALKFGGSKVYEEYFMPFMVGTLVASSIVEFITASVLPIASALGLY